VGRYNNLTKARRNGRKEHRWKPLEIRTLIMSFFIETDRKKRKDLVKRLLSFFFLDDIY